MSTCTKHDALGFAAEHADHDLRYVEDISIARRGVRVRAGELSIDGYYETWDEAGENPRLFCLDCMDECPLPDDVGINWR